MDCLKGLTRLSLSAMFRLMYCNQFECYSVSRKFFPNEATQQANPLEDRDEIR